MSLTCLLALLVPSVVNAAAPPAPDPAPEVQGPDLEELEAKRREMLEAELERRKQSFTAALLGTSAAPGTGSFATAAVILAGKHETVRAWEVADILQFQFERTWLGAATLAGNGAVSPYTCFSTVLVGHFLHCWPLIDMDHFGPLPKDSLKQIRDGNLAGPGGFEAGFYAFVLVRCKFTSAKAFAGAARKDITLTHLLEEPDRYRGEVVHVRGRLQKINTYSAPPEADQKGVRDLYEAWIGDGPQPYCVVFTEWPEGLPKKYLGKPKIDDQPQVTFDGYFFKLLKDREFTLNRRKVTKHIPFLMGHTLAVEPTVPPGDGGSPTGWVNDLIFIFLGVFMATLTGVIGLTIWLRRSDAQVRRRLFQTRSPEFILPPPEDRPAVQVAPPIYKAEPVYTAPPRFHIPPDTGQPPAGEGGPPGKGCDRADTEDPPPEDAGG